MRLPHSTIPFHFPVFPLPRSNLIRSYWKTLTHEINVSSWLVARFAIVANFLQIILKLMYCLEGSLLWQTKNWESLLFGKKQPVIAEKQTFFSKTLRLSQGRFVCWVHYCSKLCQSSSWMPKREARLFQKQLPNSNSKPFPKEQIPY